MFQISLLFFSPILSIAVIAEYSLRQIPNDYSYKNQWMERNCKNIHVLFLGSSSVLFSIDPTYLEKKSFNGAHVSQSLNYDNFIFNKFINQMDSLDFLVLDINYLSPFCSLEKSEEWWRVKNYSIYYGYNTEEIKYNYELAIHKLSTFKNASYGFLTAIGLKHYSNITVNQFGYGINYSSKNKRVDWNSGKDEALKHNNWIKEEEHFELINKNKSYVNDIIKKCFDRKIKVLLISTPTCDSYRNNLNTDFLKKKNDFCISFGKLFNNVSYFNFSNDKRFVDNDFFDGNHLNEIGAKKFTTLINDQLSNWK